MRVVGIALVVSASFVPMTSSADVLQLSIEAADGRPLAARVMVLDADGRWFPYGPSATWLSHGAPSRHFYVDGSATLVLPPGATRIRVAKGFEWTRADDVVVVSGTTHHTVVLSHGLDLRSRGWVSGDVHCHSMHPPIEYALTPTDVHRVARAEGLGIAWVLDQAPMFTGEPHPVSDAEATIYYSYEYRNQTYGHVSLLGLKSALGTGCCFPDVAPAPLLTQLHDDWKPGVGQALVLCHPKSTDDFWDLTGWPGLGLGRELPILATVGGLDALDIASYSNAPDELFLADWYSLLNVGRRIPPSAGTDCDMDGYWSEPPGGYRVYVDVGDEMTAADWVEGLKAGRTFVTNGPLVTGVSADGLGLGETIAIDGATDVVVRFQVASLEPLTHAEVVVNGAVVATVPLPSIPGGPPTNGEALVTLEQPGWLAVRVWGGVSTPFPVAPGDVTFAHTAPIYVDTGKTPEANEDRVRMLGWVNDLHALVDERGLWDSDEQRESVYAIFQAARDSLAIDATTSAPAFDVVPIDVVCTPNPSIGGVEVNASELRDVRAFDVTGRELRGRWDVAARRWRPIEQLAPGRYWIHALDSEGRRVRGEWTVVR